VCLKSGWHGSCARKIAGGDYRVWMGIQALPPIAVTGIKSLNELPIVWGALPCVSARFEALRTREGFQ